MAAGYSSSASGPTQASAPERVIHTPEKALLQKPLDERELKKRLTLGSPALVKELYEIAQRQVAYEVGRQTRLDAKATSLLTAAGLSLTVAFTFGGQILLGGHDKFRGNLTAAAVAMIAAVIAGLSAAAYAVWALRVRDTYQAVNEQSVFDQELLKEADAENPEFPDAGITEYRKVLTVHLWTIAQTHGANHESKAILIKRGQYCFLAFLALLIVVSIAVFAAVV